MDGEKVSTVEYWKKDMVQGSTSTAVIPPVAADVGKCVAALPFFVMHNTVAQMPLKKNQS
jgi:hypothetical protein